MTTATDENDSSVVADLKEASEEGIARAVAYDKNGHSEYREGSDDGIDADGYSMKPNANSPPAEAMPHLIPTVLSDSPPVSQKPGPQPEPQAQSPAKSDKKRPVERQTESDTQAENDPLPTLPLKKARTAYFIFADDKREELKQLHKGEGVAALARATGQLWSALDSSQREVYELQSAQERERLSKDIQRLKDAGLWPESGDGSSHGGDGSGKQDDDALILPVGRVRKICKLDPDVKGISKETILLITKATELFCCKLGHECVTMAQMQNRRTLMPEDVVEVCSIKERFMFLKDDIRDLARDVLEEKREKKKESGKDKKESGRGKSGEEGKGVVKTLDSYFGKLR